MEYLSEIVCGILGFLAGFSCKVVIDKSRSNVVKTTQKNISTKGDVAGGSIKK